MRVLIVDDHPFVRKGIRETLLEELDLLELEESGNGDEAFRLLLERAYDLVILDISLPGRSGLELLREALALRPGIRALMMSVYPEREFAERAYRAGAQGYLGKSSPPAEFIEAVRRILGGRRYVSPSYAELLLEGREGEGGPSLSDRELSVLRLLAEGLSLTDIGRRLNLSVKTVSTYKSRMMEKLGVSNNAELIAYALERGLGGAGPA